MTNNTWYEKQERTAKATFKPTWTKDGILWIIDRINEMTNYDDLLYQIIKKFNIALFTSRTWVEMAKRIDKDMKNGLTWEEAADRDRQRRNLMRKKAK